MQSRGWGMYKHSQVPTCNVPAGCAGLSLAPWRRWLEDGELTREKTTGYPLDVPIAMFGEYNGE